MLTVYDFCDLCYDPDEIKVTLYNTDPSIDAEILFKGTMAEAMESEFSDFKVESFDAILVNNEITLNVCE